MWGLATVLISQPGETVSYATHKIYISGQLKKSDIKSEREILRAKESCTNKSVLVSYTLYSMTCTVFDTILDIDSRFVIFCPSFCIEKL